VKADRLSDEHDLVVPNGELSFPSFLPDATFGFVRSIGADDLARCGVQAIVMNVFHLMQRPGSSVIEALGGLHGFSGWHGPIITDSGGFQAYSLIRRNPKLGSITNKGILFRPGGSSHKVLLTPEKSLRLQLRYGTDIAICLDDCTHVDDPYQKQQESVARTLSWARRCKAEFDQIVRQRNKKLGPRPLLIAVIQGGGSRELRRECAEALLATGFDGFGYGGYPLDGKGDLLVDMLKLTRDLVPARFPMIALGVGQPGNVVQCARLGYDLFDSSMPTRDARQGRLYVSEAKEGLVFSYLYVQDERHTRKQEPLQPGCDCLTCTNYSLAYLHHLFRVKDALYYRLASNHNLRFMTRLMERLRRERP